MDGSPSSTVTRVPRRVGSRHAGLRSCILGQASASEPGRIEWRPLQGRFGAYGRAVPSRLAGPLRSGLAPSRTATCAVVLEPRQVTAPHPGPLPRCEAHVDPHTVLANLLDLGTV